MNQNSTSNLCRCFSFALICFFGIIYYTQAQAVIQVPNGANIQSLIETNPPGTIYVLQPGSYSGFSVRRRAVIIGPGYFNGANTATITGTVYFSDDSNNNTTSDNSVLTGCNVNGVDINSNRKNILIQRNKIYNEGTASYISGSDGCVVNQCFIDGNISASGGTTNFQITNCIILGYINLSSASSSSSGRIAYNTIGNTISGCQPIVISSSTPPSANGIQIANNILLSNLTSCNNTLYRTDYFASFNNNVIRQGNYTTTVASNVQRSDNMSNILSNVGTSDARFILALTSPAKGVGEFNTDAGAFGGPNPYVLSGMPIGPVITELQVPSTAQPNQSIPIRVRAKIQN